MNNYAYIELLPFAVDAEVSQYRYRWAMIGHTASPEFEYGDQEAMLAWAKEQAEETKKETVLIIPGEKLTVRVVPYSESEKRHFAKLLPYSLEEDIIENVDDLHFSIGKISENQATIAYISDQWFSTICGLFSHNGIAIHQCIADFQQLSVAENTLALWFSDDRLLAHSEDGFGFSIAQHQFSLALPKILEEYPDKQLMVYRQKTENGYCLSEETIRLTVAGTSPETQINFIDQPPELSVLQEQRINFCSGIYSYQIPLNEQFKGFKSIAVLSTFVICFFIGVNWFEAATLQSENAKKKQQIEQLAREVIPRGVINDPVRQLSRKLGQAASDPKEPSQLVYLLSRLSPVIKKFDIALTTLNYSHKDKSVRISIQADSFERIESLRSTIVDNGLNAELLSSNAVDNRYQARLRISQEAL